jgi:hypothetical protein
MPQYVNYFDGWQDREFACDSCEWRGTGSGTASGEVFRDLYERDCPQCGTRLLVVSFATHEEIRAAAAASNQEAISMLKAVEESEARWDIWEVERLTRVEQLPDLDESVITASMTIGPDLDVPQSDSELKLWLNNQLVHREPGFFESIEPLKRIVPLLRAKYGERFKSIDISQASVYLYGDRFMSNEEDEFLLASGLREQGRVLVPETSDGIRASVSERISDAGSRELRRSGRVRDVEAVLADILDLMRENARRWILIIEPVKSPRRFVQVLAPSNGALIAECVSNEFLQGDDQLGDRENELLSVLGWDWPAPLNKPNWSFHDELLNTGSAVRELLIKTIRRVFDCTEDDILALKMFPSARPG